ncbi:mannitol dehydrogenase family protein [Bengtsoniella intestinalis]|uniref:mannitol dehydrogenase family protein n=1 Tax=Bengtsoniella intestinalis TaxID=3073143 RepID=UPI00391F7645
MKLNYVGLQDTAAWEAANIETLKFDWPAMVAQTEETPTWVHFGSGNLFRGFIARLHHDLLQKGLVKEGIVACDTSTGYEIYEKLFVPNDCMTLLAALKADGSIEKSVVASLGMGLRSNPMYTEEFAKLKAVFENPSLQMVSYTITEKGYALLGLDGEVLPKLAEDFKAGPDQCTQVMSVSTAMLWARFQACAAPIAMVSMDNCSHNGEKLRASLVGVAKAWQEAGFVSPEFVTWIEDEKNVAFPWSMIDKITPRSANEVADLLEKDGVEEMQPLLTCKKSVIAPFVNAEIPEYLVIEDSFPNGRPPLEEAGVYMTNRETVNDSERMKVTTCLNPLHTTLAVYGCLLGYSRIAQELKDADLKKLIETIGYQEGMPVVVDPKIIAPKAFIKEVIEQRFPNPFIPDEPQRIATDTSQKVPVRFGETIKSYHNHPELEASSLTFIPLVLAGFLRYLMAIDDEGQPMTCSQDPMLDVLQAQLSGIAFGKPETVGDQLLPLLTNANLFGIDLVEAGLSDKVQGMFKELIAGPHAVRSTLQRYLAQV